MSSLSSSSSSSSNGYYSSSASTSPRDTHERLRHARLAFPPSYVAVGISRLVLDPHLSSPIWDKCKHGIMRGSVVGLGWVALTYKVQKTFVEIFLMKSPRVTGLTHNSVFGMSIPLVTYATGIFLSSQCTMILRFFLSKNLRIARERAWQQTVDSRAKGADFWQPYVEEWSKPPIIDISERPWKKSVTAWFSQWFLTKIILAPLNLYPIVGLIIVAYFKAVMTSRYLHLPYFKAKKMSPEQIALFIEERKWDYRMFGFAAALLEGLPIIGLFFSVSNRIGAAMWAHDLEKRQHEVATGTLALVEPREATARDGTTVELKPPRTVESRLHAVGDVKVAAVETFYPGPAVQPVAAEREPSGMAGSWEQI